MARSFARCPRVPPRHLELGPMGKGTEPLSARVPKVPTLQRPDGSLATTFQEQASTLHEQFFPAEPDIEPIPLPDNPTPAIEDPPAVTDILVVAALRNMASWKAPGMESRSALSRPWGTGQSLACNKSRSLPGETIRRMNSFFATVSNLNSGPAASRAFWYAKVFCCTLRSVGLCDFSQL